jgi:hypothetical protein
MCVCMKGALQAQWILLKSNCTSQKQLFRIGFEQLYCFAIPILLQDCSEARLNSGHSHSFEDVTILSPHVGHEPMALECKRLFGVRTCLWGVIMHLRQPAQALWCRL